MSKYFGGLEALHDVSFDLANGELLALAGDNGAGKSTLVKVLSGLERPDTGTIEIEGVEIDDFNPRRARQLGIETVYQHLALCDNLDAGLNVFLGREPVRFGFGPLSIVDRGQAMALAEKLIAQIGVTLSDIRSPVRRFSGGQRQAIAIARAMTESARLLMFDEPTAALGVRQATATLDLLSGISERHTSVIMISHNLDHMFAVASRIVVLHLGEVALDRPIRATSRDEVLAAMAGDFGR